MTLGMKEGVPRKDWSVHLLPYISPSIAQQLENRGFKTIGDVAERIHTVEVGTTPEPLYPELPLLPLKAKALIQDEMIVPRAGQTYSYAIPKFVTLSLTFCVESDPANNRVFASGLSLNMGVPPKSSYCLAFDNWWRVWKTALNRISRQTDPDIESILQDVKIELDSILFRSVPEPMILTFYEAITALKGFAIKVPGDSIKDKKLVHAWVTYNYIYINEDLKPKNELRLANKLVSRLHALIQISNILELYCVVQGRKEGTYFGPKMALFYWLTDERGLNAQTSYLIRYDFTPVEAIMVQSANKVLLKISAKRLAHIDGKAKSCSMIPLFFTSTIRKRPGMSIFGQAWQSRSGVPSWNWGLVLVDY